MDGCARCDIQDVIHRYALYYDEGEMDKLEGLFADEATFVFERPIGDVAATYEGRAAICELLSARRAETHAQPLQRRHIVTNTVFSNVTASAAETISYILLGSTQDERLDILATGVYRDRLIHRDGRWLFLERRLALDSPLA
jgi:hypothetical protein